MKTRTTATAAIALAGLLLAFQPAAAQDAPTDLDASPGAPRSGPGRRIEIGADEPRGGDRSGERRRWRDRDDNPPGPRGGPGTNWENPPGPRGGPGTSPDRRWRDRDDL